MTPGGLSPLQSIMLGMGAPGTNPNAPGPPLYGQTDPRSLYLAQALQAMQKAPQQSPVQTGSDLLADALLQYGARPQQPNLSAPTAAPNPALDQAFAAGISPTPYTGGLVPYG